VVPAGMVKFGDAVVLAFSAFLARFLGGCQVSASDFRVPAAHRLRDRISEKPQQMYCNSARTYRGERCGSQARFWEARRYPAWLWIAGSMTAGSLAIVAYIALLRYGTLPFFRALRSLFA
jgi:hypothetical protein